MSVLSASPGKRRRMVETWLRGLSTTDPDLSLVPALYLTSATPMLPPRDGLHAVTVGEEVLDLLERDFLPRCHPPVATVVRRKIELARIGCQTGRGLIFQRIGRDDEARAIWQDNLARYERLGCTNQAAVQRINLASLLAVFGDNAGALREFAVLYENEAVVSEIRREALNFAALVALGTGDQRESARLARLSQDLVGPAGERTRWQALRAEEGDEEIPDVEAHPVVQSILSGFRDLPTLARAAALDGRPLEPPMLGDNPVRDSVLRGLALAEADRTDEAITLLRSAGDTAAEQGLLWWHLIARDGLAWELADTDLPGAMEAALEAVDVAELLRGAVLDADARSHVGGALSPHMTAMTMMLGVAARSEGKLRALALYRAFELGESARSRTFLEMLGDTVAPLTGSRIVRKESRLRERLTAELAAAAETGGRDRQRALTRARSTRAKLDAVVERLARGSAREADYAELRHGVPRGYDAVRRLLGASANGARPRAVLFSYYLMNSELVVVLVGREDLKVPELVTVTISEEYITAAAASITGDTIRPGAEVRADWQTSLAPLVAPISAWSEPGDVVWIVPHGPLHHVPLHAVEVDGVPLLQRNPVSYTPSASTMSHCQRRRTGRYDRIAAFADADPRSPLPYSRLQARAIVDLFGGDEVRLGRDANRAAVVAAADADVLHLACHGEFNSEDPLASGIWLAGQAEGELEMLSAADLLDTRLDVSLVTLSACRTGLSQNRPGDELIGLTRSVLYAGAATALIALWSVEDVSTGLLTHEFYLRLRRGEAAAAALRAAALMIRDLPVDTVLAACATARQAAREDGDEQAELLLLQDIADLHHRAGHYAEAINTYDELALRLPLERRGIANTGAARARLARRRPTPRRDDLRPFAHPYYWAGFVLAGDWW
ncbi:CHAT domain-containing protein [Asanoa ishikariensis]|uniref:CHAT domain-containing protein n=2 Tax=Asanoa ishikariensis TaxID=137265 RepID=A0A1H3SYK2_9ACTN|nr:CHAT domain-containing protein [Asanoa ishikariensis]